MKTVNVFILLAAAALPNLLAEPPAANEAAQLMAELNSGKVKLVQKYDANGNGKIDVQERKEYMRELSDLRKSLDRKYMTDAHGKPKAHPAMRARFESIDKNKNGKIDADEASQATQRPASTNVIKDSGGKKPSSQQLQP